jgi:UPF0271 protein
MSQVIDLNSDLGESFGAWTLGDDRAMLDVVTSANVACGFHAGDPLTMLACCRLAAERGVRIGAHVSYRDLAGFGRRSMDMPPGELYGDVLYQLAALAGIAQTAGTRVSFVKPHGALYNRLVTDSAQAAAVADAVRDFDDSLPLLGLAGSAIEAETISRDLRFVREAFVDRGYRRDGTLVPRGMPGDLVTGVSAVAERAVAMVTGGSITAADGSRVVIAADSLCVHGDTPDAVAMAVEVRAALTAHGVMVEAFV